MILIIDDTAPNGVMSSMTTVSNILRGVYGTIQEHGDFIPCSTNMLTNTKYYRSMISLEAHGLTVT